MNPPHYYAETTKDGLPIGRISVIYIRQAWIPMNAREIRRHALSNDTRMSWGIPLGNGAFRRGK